MTKSSSTTGQAKANRVLVLYGLDEDAKPHAGKFNITQRAIALKAAAAMQYKAHEVDEVAVADTLAKIPPGRLYSNGRGFVPFVRRDLFSRLMSALGLPDPLSQELGPAASAIARGYPPDWETIAVGHIVLAHDAQDGWYEAIVTGIDGDLLTLRFKDYPKEPRVARHRSAIALLNPKPPIFSKTD